MQDMPTFNFPAGTPLWVIAISVVIVMLTAFSKTMQEVKGPLGAFARWWGSRQVREIEKYGDLNDRISREVEERVRQQTAHVLDRIDALENELKEERSARKRDVKEIVMLREYAVEAAKREFALTQFAAANGFELPPPPLPTFQVWVRSRDS